MIAATGIRKTGMAAAFAALLLVLLAGVASQAQIASSSSAVTEGSKLRLLYVGRPGSDREKDFVAFLQKHFDTVQTGDLQKFKEADTQGFDVTVLDYDGDVFKSPRPWVSRQFARPLLTVGVPGAFLGRFWYLKTGYL